MSEKIKQSDGLNKSEITADLLEKAAKLKKKTASLNEKMKLTQSEVNKFLNIERESDVPE